MTRLVAALLVVAFCLVVASAQEGGPRSTLSSRTQLPFDVLEHEGQTAWRATGKGNARVEDLAAGLATALGARVTFTREAAQRMRDMVPFAASEAGVLIPRAELLDFTCDLLAAADLTISGTSWGRGRVSLVAEAMRNPPLVSEQELAALPGSEWVTVQGRALHTDTDTLRHTVQPMLTGTGARIVLSRGEYVIIGPVREARDLLALMRQFDQPGADGDGREVRPYNVPSGVAAAAVATAVEALFTTRSVGFRGDSGNLLAEDVTRAVTAVAAPGGGNRVLVRATPSQHLHVQAAISALGG
jgi:hypothetical protein